MDAERIRLRNIDPIMALDELAYEATDPDILEMRTVVGRPVHDDSDPWLSRCWFGPDAWEHARNADIARRG